MFTPLGKASRPAEKLEVVANTPRKKRARHVHLRRTDRGLVDQRGARGALVLAHHGRGEPNAAAEFRSVPVHESPAEQSEQGSVGGGTQLLLTHEAEVLRDAAVPTQGPNYRVGSGHVFATAQALGLVDAAAIGIQQAASLRRNVAGCAVHVSQTDHRGQCVQPTRNHTGQE